MNQEIRDSLVKSGVSFRANDISEHLSPEQKVVISTCLNHYGTKEL